MTIMTTCCCCLSTRIGSIIIGLICLVVSFSASVGLCFALINVDEVTQEMTIFYEDYTTAVNQNMTEARFKLIENLIGFDFLTENLRTILIVVLVFYALYTFASLFLTYGSCTNIRSLFLPWLVLEMVPFGLQVTTIIVLFVYGKDDPTLARGGVYIVSGLLDIIGFVIHVYWWMCPLAQYQSLKEEDTVVEALVPPSHPMYPAILMKY